MKGLIFTYLLCYGGSVVSLFRPWYGLLIYVCFAIIKPESLWHWAFPAGGGNFSRIIAIALLVGWAINGFGNWNFGKARYVVILIAAFVVLSTISASLAPNPDYAWRFIEAILKIVLPILVGMSLIKGRKELQQLAWTIILSQGFVAYEQNMTYVTVGISPYQTDNVLAHGMSVGAGFAFVIGLHARHHGARLLAWAAATLMAHAVMFHMSRGAMVGLAAAGLATFITLPKTRTNLLFFLVAIAVIARLAGPSVRDEFGTIAASKENRDYSAQSRFDLWTAMWNATLDNPLFGIGPDHWPLVAQDYGFPKGKEGHGLWVQILCETGIPAGCCYLAMYALAILLLWPVSRSIASKRGSEYAPYAQAALVALCAHVLQAQFGSFEGLEIPYYVLLVGAASLRLATAPRIAPRESQITMMNRDMQLSNRISQASRLTHA